MSPVIPSSCDGRTLIGMHHIDSVLFGGRGIPRGVIIDVFGRQGTGKTQMLLQAASRFAACGKRVLYVDTAGTFRPERVVCMAEASVPREAGGMAHGTSDILQMISVARIQSVAEQLSVLKRLDWGSRHVISDDNDNKNRNGSDVFDLVIVDSLTDLFLYEYIRYGDLRERNSIFFWYVRGLARLAVHRNVTVMVSNMVRTSSDKGDAEIMGAAAGLFSHVRIHLTRNSDSSARKRLGGCATRVAQEMSHQGAASNYDIIDDHVHTGQGAHATDGSAGSRRDCDVEFAYEITPAGIETYDVADSDRPTLL